MPPPPQIAEKLQRVAWLPVIVTLVRSSVPWLWIAPPWTCVLSAVLLFVADPPVSVTFRRSRPAAGWMSNTRALPTVCLMMAPLDGPRIVTPGCLICRWPGIWPTTPSGGVTGSPKVSR
jgi:hypothetical protein